MIVRMLSCVFLTVCIAGATAAASARDGIQQREQFGRALEEARYVSLWYMPPGQYAVSVRREQLRSRAHRAIQVTCAGACGLQGSELAQAVRSASPAGCTSEEFRILLEFGPDEAHAHRVYIDDTYRCLRSEWGAFFLPLDIRQLIDVSWPQMD